MKGLARVGLVVVVVASCAAITLLVGWHVRTADERARRDREWGRRGGRQVPPTPTVSIHELAFSNDGRRLLATFLPDGRGQPPPVLRRLTLWDVDTGQELLVVRHREAMYSIAWLPDSRHFFVSRMEGPIELWDAEKGQAVRTFGEASVGEGVLAVSADGKRALSSSAKGNFLWDINRGEVVCFLYGATGIAHHASFSPDGKRAMLSFAAWHGSDAAALWDLDSPLKPRHRWEREAHYTLSYGTFSPDGRHILAHLAEGDGERHEYRVLWEVATGKEVWRSKDVGTHFTTDGKTLIGATQGGELGRWEATTGKLLWKKPMDFRGRVGVFSPDRTRLALAQGGCYAPGGGTILVELLDTTEGQQIRVLPTVTDVD